MSGGEKFYERESVLRVMYRRYTSRFVFSSERDGVFPGVFLGCSFRLVLFYGGVVDEIEIRSFEEEKRK